jgi:hypothetical protein
MHMTEVPSTIPWYRSNVLRWLVVAAVSQGLNALDASDKIPQEAVSQVADWALNGIETLALLAAGYSRVRQPTPPVTLRKEPTT